MQARIKAAIGALKANFTIPNNEIALGNLSMDNYDYQMRGVVASSRNKFNQHHLAALLALGWIYSETINFKNPLSKDNIYFAMRAIIILLFLEVLLKKTINHHPFFTQQERDHANLTTLRGMRRPFLTIDDIQENAKNIKQHKIGNCIELCMALVDDLMKLPELQGRFIQQLYLSDSNNHRHNHTLLIISDEPISSDLLQGKTLEEIAKLPQFKNKNVTIVDPWYDTVMELGKFDDKISAEKPLLNYPIYAIDYTILLGNNGPEIVAETKKHTMK